MDKAFLSLAGRPLVAHLLARLHGQAGAIAISANGDPTRFTPFGLPVLPDPPELLGKGPLAGLAAGLAWAAGRGAAALLTAPVDTPWLPADVAARLAPAPAVAVWRGRQHHLVALWPTGFGPTGFGPTGFGPTGFAGALVDLLRRPGDYRVRDALGLAGARPVGFAETADPFLNINTPADLEAARARAGRTSAPAPPG